MTGQERVLAAFTRKQTDRVPVDLGGHRSSGIAAIAYAKLRWRFHSRFYLNYRFNWGDDDSTGIAFQRRVNTFTLGYQPKPWLRLKAEYSDHDFDDAPRRDFRYWGLSIGTLF